MKWYVYKKDDPSTWPEIDCPLLVCVNHGECSDFLIVSWWDNKCERFLDTIHGEEVNVDECFYAYIAYVPQGYKTHKVSKCVDDAKCPYGCNDNGYCMYDELTQSDRCGSKMFVNEYEIEMEKIWKEFE